MPIVQGPFHITLTPQPDEEPAGLRRLVLDKRFEGDLCGQSRGQMLAAHGSVEGSAAYVAIEHIEGTLAGREGSFRLVHLGLRQGDTSSLRVTVVPDSGTGALVGLTGEMQIAVHGDGAHTYRFDYHLGT